MDITYIIPILLIALLFGIFGGTDPASDKFSWRGALFGFMAGGTFLLVLALAILRPWETVAEEPRPVCPTVEELTQFIESADLKPGVEIVHVSPVGYAVLSFPSGGMAQVFWDDGSLTFHQPVDNMCVREIG